MSSAGAAPAFDADRNRIAKRASEGARFLVQGPQGRQISVAGRTIFVADAHRDDGLGTKSR